MKRIYSYIAALLMLSLMASQVHAKEPVTQSDISGSAKEKCVSSEQTNDKIEADLQRHLERMKSEDIAKGYLREEKTYAEEVSLVRGRCIIQRISSFMMRKRLLFYRILWEGRFLVRRV